MCIAETYNEKVDIFLLNIRYVACSYSDKVLNNRTIEYIYQIQKDYFEFKKNEINYKNKLSLLSKECNWNLEMFLQEIIDYPKIIPRVRKLDDSLHFIFKEVVNNHIIEPSMEIELIEYANKIQDFGKRKEVLNEIKFGKNYLYITSEILNNSILSEKEYKRVCEIFSFFY